MKQQASWVVKGMKGSNKMMTYVEEFFNKKTLSKIGYSFDPETLTTADVDAFNIIESVISKHEADEMKKMKSKGRKHGR